MFSSVPATQYLEAVAFMRGLADIASVRIIASSGLPACQKDDGTPVTVLDVELNDLVITAVASTWPACGVLGEERSWHPNRDQLFIVDPIDGTAPLVAGLSLATFAMAYVVDGVTVAAVVADPFTGHTFFATSASGAYVNDTPLCVPASLVPPSFTVNVEALGNTAYDPEVGTALLRHAGFIVTCHKAFIGPAVRVATGGMAGGVFGRPSLWDCLAPALICTEAGAVVTTFDGTPVCGTELDDGLVVAHPLVHAQLLEVFTQAGGF